MNSRRSWVLITGRERNWPAPIRFSNFCSVLILDLANLSVLFLSMFKFWVGCHVLMASGALPIILYLS